MKKTIFAALFVASVAAPAMANTDVHQMVTRVALANGLQPELVHAIVQAESTYRCNARNGGNIGIMQVHPRTARSVGVHGKLTDCRNGIEAGVRYLAKAIRTHGMTCAGISAYNTGIYGKGRCTSYGRKIMAKMRTRLTSR